MGDYQELSHFDLLACLMTPNYLGFSTFALTSYWYFTPINKEMQKDSYLVVIWNALYCNVIYKLFWGYTKNCILKKAFTESS